MFGFSDIIIDEVQGALCDKLTIALFSLDRINLDLIEEHDRKNLERAKLALQNAGKIAQMLHGLDLFDQVLHERRAEGKER